MRDGSLDDVVGSWVDRIMEEHWGRNPGDNEAAVYFALLKHAAVGLLERHARYKPVTDYGDLLIHLLEAVRAGLDSPAEAAGAVDAMPEPAFVELVEPPAGPAQAPQGEHRDYWASDSWKKDFYTTFSRWFWDMKDYAPAAGRRKSEFLWDVAEVWVATAASALVYYAQDDRQRWFETAQMLRRYADLTEEDGLRSLPWGRWGRYSEKNRRPKPEA
jgi:hypothetical protein